MICFLPCAICKSEAVKNLKAAALQPISLPVKYLRTAFVDYSGIYTAPCHPGSHHQALVSQQCIEHRAIPRGLTQQGQRRRSSYAQISKQAIPKSSSLTHRNATREALPLSCLFECYGANGGLKRRYLLLDFQSLCKENEDVATLHSAVDCAHKTFRS